MQVKVLSVLLTLLNDSNMMETAAGCGAKDGINFDVNSTSCARAAPIEATGLAYNSFARGAVAMSTIFLGPALLKLAEEAATSNNNCNYDEDNHYGNDDDIDSNCIQGGGRIYGMKPTSLLTNIGVFSGLISSVFTPLFGALVDHTPHRKTVGQISSIILSVVKGIEIFINQSTWFLVSVLQVVNFVVYNAYLCAVYAYTAELSNDPNEQTNYNSRFQSIYYVSMLMFLVLVMVISTVFGTGDVGTARISQTVAFIVCSSVFIFSWRYFFRERPALRQIPPGSTLVQAGFNKLSYTCQHIWTNWYSLRFFLLSVSLSESATAALSTIATTYMTSVLEMQASDIGKVFFCVFVAGIPGSKLGGKIGVALNPLRSALLCLVVFIINTTLASHALKGPADKHAMYIFAAVWGICISWLHPAHVSLYSTIIPRGQETEVRQYLFIGSRLEMILYCNVS